MLGIHLLGIWHAVETRGSETRTDGIDLPAGVRFGIPDGQRVQSRLT